MSLETYTLDEFWTLFPGTVEQRPKFLETACLTRSVVVEVRECAITWFVRIHPAPELGLSEKEDVPMASSESFTGLLALEAFEVERLFEQGHVELFVARRLLGEGEPSYAQIEPGPQGGAPVLRLEDVRVLRRDVDQAVRAFSQLIDSVRAQLRRDIKREHMPLFETLLSIGTVIGENRGYRAAFERLPAQKKSAITVDVRLVEALQLGVHRVRSHAIEWRSFAEAAGAAAQSLPEVPSVEDAVGRDAANPRELVLLLKTCIQAVAKSRLALPRRSGMGTSQPANLVGAPRGFTHGATITANGLAKFLAQVMKDAGHETGCGEQAIRKWISASDCLR